jgi:soluble lytic murein transglycosylase-like protein
MGTLWVKLLAVVFLLFAPVAPVRAAVYTYVDAEGTPHFTDAPTKSYYRPLPGFGLPPGANLNRGQYAELIDSIAAEQGVDPALVRAIIRAESNFERRAVSRKGAQGLMQLMPGTAGRYSVSNAFDPAENIRGGVRYLKFLQDAFPGRTHLAVAAYNAGENAVLRYGGIPPFAETRQYVARVFRFYSEANVLPVATRRSGPAAPGTPAGSTPAKVYRQVAPDGTPHYSNMAPLVRSQATPPR